MIEYSLYSNIEVMPNKKLYRSKKESILFGVCGGLGEYFEIDPVVVRLVFLLLVALGGSGFPIYLILLILIPRNPNQPTNPIEDDRLKDLADEIKEKAETISNAFKK